MTDKYQYIVNMSHDFITLIDRNYVYEIVNDSYCKAMEKPREKILGSTVAQVWGEERFQTSIRKHLDECFTGKEVQCIDTFRFGPFEKHMHIIYYPYPQEGGPVTHAVVCSHDMTQINQVECRLTQYEFRDPTTGLFNRRSLDIILDKEIEQARRSQDNVRVVLYVSVENLGRVNEMYGAAIGDLLLENTGLRIQKCLRAGDYLFRFVGNELTCLLAQIRRNTDAARVAAKIAEQVKMPYHRKEGDIRIGCNIGISAFPGDGDTADEIIRHAASAMRQARRSGMDFAFYNPAVHRRASERMLLESELHQAFEREQFQLAYQPIVDAVGRIKGAEALIRWTHPQKGPIPPRDFIPVAEESGIIRSISKWALYTAAEELRLWATKYGRYVSVNLSAVDFCNPELPDVLASALQRAGIASPGFLKLEITESQCMIEPETTIRQMTLLANAGFDIFIDDFGTGSSSLGYLKRLPAGAVKIDRSFVVESTRSPEDYEYLANIAALARSRRKAVILEGVETAQEHEILKRVEPDALQGYHFSRPISAGDLEALYAVDARLPLPAITARPSEKPSATSAAS